MIVIDMDMPKNCLSCKYKYVCSIYENIGVLEQTKLKLDKQRHPKCPIKCDIEDIETEIINVVNEEIKEDMKWAKGLHYALKIIDKHIRGNEE